MSIAKVNGIRALETCVHFGEKLVIADPKKNRCIGSSGQKDDSLDALKLAKIGRGGYIKEKSSGRSTPAIPRIDDSLS